MPFSKDVEAEAYMRCRGRCECARESHQHVGACRKVVPRAEAHFRRFSDKPDGDPDGLANCVVLCYRCFAVYDLDDQTWT